MPLASASRTWPQNGAGASAICGGELLVGSFPYGTLADTTPAVAPKQMPNRHATAQVGQSGQPDHSLGR